MYQCFECHTTYKYKRNLQRHLEERHFSAKKIFKCDICKRIFTRKSNLKRHFFNQHSLTEILDDLEDFPIENSAMDYTMKSEIYEDISSDEESFEEDLSLKENSAEEFVSECEETSEIPTSEIPTSVKKNSITIQLIKKTVSYGDGQTEVIKEINFSYTEEMKEVSPSEVFSNFLNDFMEES